MPAERETTPEYLTLRGIFILPHLVPDLGKITTGLQQMVREPQAALELLRLAKFMVALVVVPVLVLLVGEWILFSGR